MLFVLYLDVQFVKCHVKVLLLRRHTPVPMVQEPVPTGLLPKLPLDGEPIAVDVILKAITAPVGECDPHDGLALVSPSHETSETAPTVRRVGTGPEADLQCC